MAPAPESRIGRLLSLSKPDQPYTIAPDGLRLAIRLTPRGGRDGIGGIVLGADGRSVLQVRVSAPPVEGAANDALVALLAEALDLPRSAVMILSGETGRVKLLRLSGDGPAIAARLDALVSPR